MLADCPNVKVKRDSFGNLLQQRGDVVRLPIGFAGGMYDADTGLTRFPWRDSNAAPFGVLDRALHRAGPAAGQGRRQGLVRLLRR